MSATLDGITPLRRVSEPVCIKPGHCGGHGAKMQVVDDGIGVSGLAFAAADFLFELFEARLNFPPCAVVLNDLHNIERKVSGK